MNGQGRAAQGGYTLIETAVSLAVFMLVTLGVVNASAFASAALERVSARGELLENARAAVDVMSAHIKAAESVTVSERMGQTLIKLSVMTDGRVQPREFVYSSRLSATDAGYHRIEFGTVKRNELASYIASMKASVKGDILTISVVTDDRVENSRVTVEPVRLTVKIRLYNS